MKYTNPNTATLHPLPAKNTLLVITKVSSVERANACPYLPPSYTWGVSFSLHVATDRKKKKLIRKIEARKQPQVQNREADLRNLDGQRSCVSELRGRE